MHSNFCVWDADDPGEYQDWIDFWLSWPEREVSSHPSYVNLFRDEGDRVMCASYQSSDGLVLYAFIMREIRGASDEAPVLRDITTAYGYGGPYTWKLLNTENVTADFWSCFDNWASSQSVVTEFVRFGLFSEALLPYPGEIVSRSQNIVRSLELDDDAMFMSFDQKVRKNVKKATRNGLSIKIDDTGAFLSDFMRIYESTMHRREAGSNYYFSRKFFESVQRDLHGQFVYIHVCLENEIVSTELILVSQNSSYSFLGGTDSSYFDLRPNDFLKYEIIRWSKSRGLKNFVLGGGATPNDGIERYKRSFAPSGSVDFRTGQRILMPEAYAQLVALKEAQLASDGALASKTEFFPAYRRPS
jgi:hypothetical protein